MKKKGKANEVPCHHHLPEEYRDAYIRAVGMAEDRRRPPCAFHAGAAFQNREWKASVNIRVGSEKLTR